MVNTDSYPMSDPDHYSTAGMVTLGTDFGNAYLLLVTPINFASWIDRFTWTTFQNPDKSATGDPDQDGKTNQEEYAFGLDPTRGGSCDPISVPLNKTTGKFCYTRSATPATTGIAYSVWTSDTLAADGWTDATATATQRVIAMANGVETVEVTLSGAPLSATQWFVRMKAVVPAQ